ncbi:fibronectin type III domain-containing protein [Marinitoga aeolica]|uniref:Fibronectin type III domain-containing protein n=1 Tax=Marinitoga aeolica TaxID=2809031 RepID=A0ABY8PQT6_9BACT|nr:hypothetical protein [Marinitoga aeolica]WGS64977.1 hypothetical protein JRV97_00020 [Marinitoga aeolica]
MKKVFIPIITLILILISCMNLNNPPTIPNNPVPADKAKDIPVNTTLSWNATDPDKDILIYKVYFGENSNPPLVNKGQVDNKYNPGILKYNTTYYWKIVAIDSNGFKTEGDIWSFTTKPQNTAPELEITYPKNNSTNIELNPTITWSATDNENDEVKYNVYLNGESKTENYTSKSYQLSNLNTNTTYTVKIVVIDEYNAITEKTVSFTTTKAPTISLNKPDNNSTVIGKEITLSWTASDPDNDTLTYDIYLDKNTNPTTKVKSDITETSTTITVNDYRTYYWKVVAKDDKGAKTESNIYTFTNKIPRWQKTFGGSNGDMAHSIQQTTDGGYIVAGTTYSNDGDVSGNHGYYDYWIIKLDEKGNLKWQKTFGGSDMDEAYSIQETSDNNFIIAGYTRSTDKDISNNHGNFDYWIIKTDSEGNLLWQKTFGGNGEDIAFSILETNNDNFIIAGTSASNNGKFSNNHGDFDYWIIKTNNEGNLLWQKNFGGSDWDIAYSMQKTNDNCFIIVGYTKSNDNDILFNHGNFDYWIVKIDSYGNLLWQKTFGGSNDDYAQSIEKTSDGGFIIVGYTNSNDSDVTDNHGDYDYWVIKIDNNGNLLWQKTFGGSKNDYAYNIKKTIDNNFIISGESYSNDGDVTDNHGNYDYWIIKIDNNGNLLWQKTFGGSDNDCAQSVEEANYGSLIITGYTKSNNGDITNNHGSYDYWIIKTDKNGNIQ